MHISTTNEKQVFKAKMIIILKKHCTVLQQGKLCSTYVNYEHTELVIFILSIRDPHLLSALKWKEYSSFEE